jgi:hypothetical protein
LVLGTRQPGVSNGKLADKPEQVGPALAQIVQVSAGQEAILGQAWLAAPNQLVTCGHVVDAFVNDPAGLFLFFPGSGNRYPVKQVRLHPSFVRQPDGLVKFDAAVVSAPLQPPDSLVEPLPFSFEQSLRQNQSLWAIRYPAHLGQFSAALQPLSQDGHFLGYLRKHDNFHLLHDLPLSPGDSGAPITDGHLVVALHCGDTATLPGLNLPTTSIRMALWVDALRELGLHATGSPSGSRRSPVVALALALICGLIAFGVTTSMRRVEQPPPVAPQKVCALRLEFNERLDNFHADEPLDVVAQSTNDCLPYLFFANKRGNVVKVYPKNLAKPMAAGQDVDLTPTSISGISDDLDMIALAVDKGDAAAVEDVKKLVNDVWPDPTDGALSIPRSGLIDRIQQLQLDHPAAVYFKTFTLRVLKKGASP